MFRLYIEDDKIFLPKCDFFATISIGIFDTSIWNTPKYNEIQQE